MPLADWRPQQDGEGKESKTGMAERILNGGGGGEVHKRAPAAPTCWVVWGILPQKIFKSRSSLQPSFCRAMF